MKETYSLKSKIQKSPVLKSIILIANFVLPIIILVNMTVPGATDSFFMFFNWLWVGFYSTIFSLFFLKKNIWFKLLIIVNVLILVFALISSQLAGFSGLMYVILKIIIPLMPESWIWFDLQP